MKKVDDFCLKKIIIPNVFLKGRVYTIYQNAFGNESYCNSFRNIILPFNLFRNIKNSISEDLFILKGDKE
jgi:hypothetical protein